MSRLRREGRPDGASFCIADPSDTSATDRDLSGDVAQIVSVVESAAASAFPSCTRQPCHLPREIPWRPDVIVTWKDGLLTYLGSRRSAVLDGTPPDVESPVEALTIMIAPGDEIMLTDSSTRLTKLDWRGVASFPARGANGSSMFRESQRATAREAAADLRRDRSDP